MLRGWAKGVGEVHEPTERKTIPAEPAGPAKTAAWTG